METKLGTQLYKALDILQISQSAFAEELDISKARLNVLINGKLADTKSRPTPELMGRIYSATQHRNDDMAMGLLTAYLGDMVGRARISGAECPSLCGVCRHWQIDLQDSTKGCCAEQQHPENGKCNCFSLATI